MRYRNRDAIILLGLNPTAADEAQALRRFGNEVTLLANGARSNWVTVDGQRFDLADAGQVAAFLQHLRVPEPRRQVAARAFGSVDPDMGDELGQLAMAWALAERGGVIPGRMVISGEHVGSGIFWSRKSPGVLRISDLATLVGAFPQVANAIEDLHTSACQRSRLAPAADLAGLPSLQMEPHHDAALERQDVADDHVPASLLLGV
jgi:hypothetical protein